MKLLVANNTASSISKKAKLTSEFKTPTDE